MCKEVYGYVYMVKNLVNGKIYFGITVNDFQRRYDGNIAKHTHNDHLKSSIKKYGIENFEINKEFDVAYTEDDLYDLEDMYMCIYNTIDRRYGYNKRRSGSKHKGSGRPNEETRKKLSESRKGKLRSEETKQKISETMKVRVMCLETKQVFDSVKDAQEWLGKGNIAHHLRGNTKSAGKHPITGEKLHWMYYSDYLKLQEEEQQNKTQDLVTEVA